MIDTFLLPAKYKMAEPIGAQNSFDEKISKATTVDSSQSIFRSNNRTYNEENSDGFTYNAANKEYMSSGQMYDLVYSTKDDFNGESEYATDAIRTQLQQTIREIDRITLEKQTAIHENERITLEKQNAMHENERFAIEIMELRSENVRLCREKLEIENKLHTQV